MIESRIVGRVRSWAMKAKSTAFLVAQIFCCLAKNTDSAPPRKSKLQKIKRGTSCALLGRTSDEELVFRRRNQMKDREKWMELCRQASVEQDPKNLLELTDEII